MRSLSLFAAATALLVTTVAPAVAATPVAGKWLTDGGESIIDIGPCGADLCGRVVKVFKGNPANPRLLDLNNPDATLRTRSIVGIPLLTGFRDGGRVWNGRIYDPKSGKSYRSELSRNPDGTLLVKGCIGPFCRKLVWTAAR